MSLRERLPSIGARGLAIALVTLVLFSSVGAAAGTVVFGNGATPSPYINEDQLTKAAHPTGQAVTTYEANDGSQASLDAIVNETDSQPNVYTFSPAQIDAADYGAFPHDKSDVSALTASEWTTSGASVSDTETGPGVEAVQITTSAAGDSASFSNFSVTSDENKKFGQIGVVVHSISSDGTVNVNFTDADGDYKQATINTSQDVTGNAAVIANGTGTYVWQEQFGQLTTNSVSGSDGTFNDIESISVTSETGTVDASIFALNAEKTGEWQFGDHHYQNADDEWETVTVTEPIGDVSIASMGSLGPTFSGDNNVTVHDLRFPVHYTSSALPASDTQATVSDAGNTYPAYDKQATIYTRLSVPEAYDLGHQGLSLRVNQSLPSDRYVSVEVAEGTSDTKFSEISNTAWTDVTGQFSGENETHVLDDTIQPGQEIVVRSQLRLTQDDVTAMQQSPAGGGGGFFSNAGGNGGIWGAIVGGVGGIVAIIGNYLRKARKAV
ncbi:hypothetical protein [Halobellus inordinatus]|uniref:hypothetical protein n=1 Tax=Halobellus inordinatus TaxID=1126236 RepID=UPI00210A50F7|nr:hypothetical protein [Halobellus inordinatus]